MVVIRWFAKRRFNWIDVVSVWGAVQAIGAENWWAAAFAFVVGAVLSTWVERATGENR